MMFGLTLSTVFRLLTGLAFGVVLAWGLRMDHLRAYWRDITVNVSVAVTNATGKHVDNDKLAKAVEGLGTDLVAERAIREAQSSRIISMGEETKRLQVLSAEWQEKALEAMADRDHAIWKLKTMAKDPGDRADCIAQLKAAEEALDLAFREGL